MADSKHILTVVHIETRKIYRQSSNQDPFKWAYHFNDRNCLTTGKAWESAIYTNRQLEINTKMFKVLNSKELTEMLKIG